MYFLLYVSLEGVSSILSTMNLIVMVEPVLMLDETKPELYRRVSGRYLEPYGVHLTNGPTKHILGLLCPNEALVGSTTAFTVYQLSALSPISPSFGEPRPPTGPAKLEAARSTLQAAPFHCLQTKAPVRNSLL